MLSAPCPRCLLHAHAVASAPASRAYHGPYYRHLQTPSRDRQPPVRGSSPSALPLRRRSRPCMPLRHSRTDRPPPPCVPPPHPFPQQPSPTGRAPSLPSSTGDVFGLFAIVCWTFSKVQNQHPDELLVYLTAPAFLRTINGVLVASLGIAAAALVAGDLVLLVFGLFEEALCDRRRNRLAMPLFLRLVVAPIAWALAQLPLIVLLGTLRLSLLPLVVFRSLDSEHAIHASFYRPIFAYLAHGKGAGFDDECQQVRAGGAQQ